MARIPQIDPAEATGRAKTLLGEVQETLGLIPNMTRAMANAPVVLEGYLRLSAALAGGRLSARDRERIALAVAQAMGCDYGLATHSALGRMAGLTADQIRDSRLGTAVDPRSEALVRFALKVLDARGRVDDDDLDDVRAAGFDDGAIAEVVANVALGVFTNSFNLVAGTDVDLPRAPALDEARRLFSHG